MIKIAVVSLGRNLYCAFSLNQDYPLSTTVRAKGYEHKEDIERIIIGRFHSQRREYMEAGAIIKLVGKRGSLSDRWKFIWTDTRVFWNKVEPTTEKQVLVDEPGLRIEKHMPLKEIASISAKKLEQMYMAEADANGKCSFTPVTDDIIAESEIPTYIKLHQKA